MKILFVSMTPFENNASATIRNKTLIKGLSKLGHDIDVITLKPDENSINYDNSMNDVSQFITDYYYIDIHPLYYKLMAKKNIIDFSSISYTKNINKKRTIMSTTRNFIKRIYDKTKIFDAQKFNVSGISKIDIDYSKYDTIISSSDPKSSHLIVKRIFKENKNCNAKWIQYWGDPMYNDITRINDWRSALVKYYEKKLLSEADRIVYVSPLTLKIQQSTFKEFSHKMDYAHQSITDIYSNENNILISEERKIKVGYFGAYNSRVRNIMPLYNAAIGSDFDLIICGSSDITIKNRENILIKDMLSYEETKKLENESDILVCICNLRGTQIPGKIYYSAGYMKPIIIILDGEYKEYLRDYFKNFDRYILCENEENSIKEAISRAKLQLNKKYFNVIDQLKPKYMAKKILGNYYKYTRGEAND